MEKNNMNVNRADNAIYLNALKITLSKPDVSVIKIESNANIYSTDVKPWLENTPYIAYWTPRSRSRVSTIFTSYVTAINLPIDSLEDILRENLENKISVKGMAHLTIDHNSIKLLEGAVMKRFINVGWQCFKRYGNIKCRSPAPMDSQYLFDFYRAVEFRVICIGDDILLILRPHLQVVGPSIKDLLVKYGDQVLQKIVNKECIALREEERTYRKAMLLNMERVSSDEYIAKVIFYDGIEKEVNIKDVRLAGNVLFYKNLIIDLFGDQAYKKLEKLQRSFSFSLGPKESSFKLAENFKNEIFKVIHDSNIFPFNLGDVSVDARLELFEVTKKL